MKKIGRIESYELQSTTMSIYVVDKFIFEKKRFDKYLDIVNPDDDRTEVFIDIEIIDELKKLIDEIKVDESLAEEFEYAQLDELLEKLIETKNNNLEVLNITPDDYMDVTL